MSFTYTTLSSALASFTEDQGTEFAAIIPTLIMLGELKLVRDLDLDIFRGTDTSKSLASGVTTLTKPTDLVSVRSIHYTDADGELQVLDERSFDFCKTYWPDALLTTATPKFFADFSDTTWLIAGTPSGNNAVTIRYVKRPTGLSAGNENTWLATNVPDALLWACLSVAEQFLKADERIAVWKQNYAEALGRALQELKPEHGDEYQRVATTPVKGA